MLYFLDIDGKQIPPVSLNEAGIRLKVIHLNHQIAKAGDLVGGILSDDHKESLTRDTLLVDNSAENHRQPPVRRFPSSLYRIQERRR